MHNLDFLVVKSQMKNTESLWGGRFTEKADEQFFEFNRSFGFDQELFEADIQGSLGHCRGLEHAGVISPEESKEIQNALNMVLAQSSQHLISLNDNAAEDIHSLIESKLIAAIGDAGRKLHTGRSRNDQVATAVRIWMRGAIDETLKCLHDFQTALVSFAEENSDGSYARLHPSSTGSTDTICALVSCIF